MRDQSFSLVANYDEETLFYTIESKIHSPVNSPAGHQFTCPKSLTKLAIRGDLRDVTAKSDIKCHIKPVISDYSPCLLFSIVWNDFIGQVIVRFRMVPSFNLTPVLSSCN